MVWLSLAAPVPSVCSLFGGIGGGPLLWPCQLAGAGGWELLPGAVYGAASAVVQPSLAHPAPGDLQLDGEMPCS